MRLQRPRIAIVARNLSAGLPACTAAPAVTGTSALTSTTGTWVNSPTYTYQWRRKGVGNITGATAATYTLVGADSGYTVECEVTGTNGAGAATVRSNGVVAS